jgi:putative Mg2+ transporter-C (MgtC) family protein
MDFIIILIRLILTFACAFLFGLERQRSHKPITFGTFIFVSVGACALAITAIIWSPENPLPLLGTIVTGIGFLGAGAMIKTNDKILGATTAASIWLFAIFGLLVGTGEYSISAIIYVAIWVVVLFDRYLAEKGIGSYQRRLIIKTNKIINEKEIRKILLLETKKNKLISVEVDKHDAKLTIEYLIDGSKENLNRIPKRLYEEEWFAWCKIE